MVEEWERKTRREMVGGVNKREAVNSERMNRQCRKRGNLSRKVRENEGGE
jgi:hypothetical protein